MITDNMASATKECFKIIDKLSDSSAPRMIKLNQIATLMSPSNSIELKTIDTNLNIAWTAAEAIVLLHEYPHLIFKTRGTVKTLRRRLDDILLDESGIVNIPFGGEWYIELNIHL